MKKFFRFLFALAALAAAAFGIALLTEDTPAAQYVDIYGGEG